MKVFQKRRFSAARTVSRALPSSSVKKSYEYSSRSRSQFGREKAKLIEKDRPSSATFCFRRFWEPTKFCCYDWTPVTESVCKPQSTKREVRGDRVPPHKDHQHSWLCSTNPGARSVRPWSITSRESSTNRWAVVQLFSVATLNNTLHFNITNLSDHLFDPNSGLCRRYQHPPHLFTGL